MSYLLERDLSTGLFDLQASGTSFFLIISYSRNNYAQSYEETKGQVPLGPLFGKQNIQAKEVFLGYKMPKYEMGKYTRARAPLA